MNQPPPLHGELPSRPPGESSGLTKLLGVLMVGPLFVLAIGTLWVPAFSIVLTSFQNRTGGGSTAGANWANALGFTVAIAVVRLLASIFPIIFAVSLAFTGAVTRNIARTVFLFFGLLLSPLTYGLSCLVFLYQVQPDVLTKPFAAQVALLFAEALLTSTVVTGIALWLFPGIRASTESEKQGSNRGRLILALVLLLGAVACGFQAFTLSLTVFGGPSSSTVTLALLGYQGMMRDVPVDARLWFQLGIVGMLGLVSGILLVVFNFRFDLGRISTKPEPVGCAIGAVSGSILFLISAVALVPVLACLLGLFGWSAGSAAGGITPSLIKQVTPGIEHQLLLLLAWFVIVVPATYLSAFGIGGLRPFGRHSEWLLLPFFPFFFISIVTLWPVFLQVISNVHLFESPLVLLYPLLVNVPFLVFLTFFFKGQREQWMNATPRPSFFRGVLLPSLPITVTFAIATSVFVVRDLLWQLLSSPHNDNLAQILSMCLAPF